MELRHTPAFEPEPGDTGGRDSGTSGAVAIALWVAGLLGLALLLTIGFLGYLNPAMLIEFASLRLCG
jgi:hypothetical protein